MCLAVDCARNITILRFPPFFSLNHSDADSGEEKSTGEDLDPRRKHSLLRKNN
jgi:hypothetical protein